MKFKFIKKFLKGEEEHWKKKGNSFLFLVGLLLAIGGLRLFYVGFHNFDSAQNMIFIREDITSGLLREGIDFDVDPYTEQTSRGRYISLEEGYVMGVNQILKSIFFIITGFFMMGYYFRKMEEKGTQE